MLGTLMNTRGLTELIALNLALDLGVISEALFTALVLMALVTTFMAGPLLNLLDRRAPAAVEAARLRTPCRVLEGPSGGSCREPNPRRCRAIRRCPRSNRPVGSKRE